MNSNNVWTLGRRRSFPSVLPVLSFLLLGLQLLAGCDAMLQEPPVSVTYRDSLLGIGKILQLDNLGKEALTTLELRIETPAGDVKNHTIPRLEAAQLMEIGWKKLEGFEIPMGSQVTLRCDGYSRPLRVRLKAPES